MLKQISFIKCVTGLGVYCKPHSPCSPPPQNTHRASTGQPVCWVILTGLAPGKQHSRIRAPGLGRGALLHWVWCFRDAGLRPRSSQASPAWELAPLQTPPGAGAAPQHHTQWAGCTAPRRGAFLRPGNRAGSLERTPPALAPHHENLSQKDSAACCCSHLVPTELENTQAPTAMPSPDLFHLPLAQATIALVTSSSPSCHLCHPP